MKYLIAHDLGTSGNKAVLYSENGELIYSCTKPYPLFVDGANHCEQNANDWWSAVISATREITERVSPSSIAVVSFSGQMMGCLCVDRNGEPLKNSLIWADMRSFEEEEEIKRLIDMKEFFKITGHRISCSYGASKLLWIKKHEPEIYQKTYKVLNSKDYIILKLTGRFVTDYTDAAGMALWDLKKAKWSNDLISLLNLDKNKLPDAVLSTEIVGTVTKEAARLTGLLEGTPVVCGTGDGVAAAVGTGSVRPGVAYSCLGTSSWIALTSTEPLDDPEMMNNTWPHVIPGLYMPCGSMQCGGGSFKWAVNELYKTEVYNAVKNNEKDKYAIPSNEAALSPMGAKGLLFLPYLIGERSPRWNPLAKGSFVGLTLEHNRGDMLRAVMEGVSLNLGAILKIMKDCGCKADSMIAVGGAANNALWRQIFADVYNLPVLKPNFTDEATSVGAAITGGVGIGLFNSFDVTDRFFQIESKTLPVSENHLYYSKRLEVFNQLYNSLVPVFEKL